MKNRNESIRKMVSYLNNPEHNGGFWLPNIQRPFVWDTTQIEKLFDSLMREYPISTLLIWRTKSTIKRRKFIDIYKDGISLSQFQIPEDQSAKMLVLDGQQRLQSLFIALMGSYNKQELFFNVFSGEQASPEEIRYKFKFMLPEKAIFPWVSFRKIVFSNEQPNRQAESLLSNVSMPISDSKKDRLLDNLWKAHRVFVTDDALSYQELDSVDNPDLYTENDVVEIFIRANSGGTKLGKSDLLFSLLTASWDDADEAMEDLLHELNASGYEFTRDFILKTCLVMLDKGAAYDVKKFRDNETKEEIVAKWSDISNAIKDVRDFLASKTYIRSDQALPSYLALVPVIYFRYNYPQKWTDTEGLETYFLRTLLSGAFSGRPDGLIDKCVRRIKKEKAFNVSDMFEIIHQDGRNLDITEETILNATYGSKSIHLLFNLWYRQFNYIPAYQGNLPQVDHIFPQSVLRSIKEVNPDTGRNSLLAYPTKVRDQIANCMLLTADENGFQGKCAKTPEEWFAEKPEAYLDLHLIPKDKALWKIENYPKFITARKKLIVEKFSGIVTHSLDVPSAKPTLSENKDIFNHPQMDVAKVEPVAHKEETPLTTKNNSTNETIYTVNQRTVSPKSRGDFHPAESILLDFCKRISSPSKYIAGFRAENGLELALERVQKGISIWTQQTDVDEELGFKPFKFYESTKSRNSNLNRKNCPALVLGNPILNWKFNSSEELIDFINWYSQLELELGEE
nr:DUF262 domain-containing protein [uncultured Amphritea sp.]